MKAFKAYDIRGIYNLDWDREDAYEIGYFLPRLLKTNEILVGRDIRLSSDEIFNSLSRGIMDAGANTHDLGLCTTPMVYWATAKLGFKGSVQITASHNPKEYNGLKVSGPGAMPIGYAAGLNKIKGWMETEEPEPVSHKGELKRLDVRADYLSFLKSFRPDLSSLKLVVDASNGMAGMFLEEIFGSNVDYMNLEPDGDFPGHDPNPLELENVQQLSSKVSKGDYDFGIIFDGDADRVMFVDEKGEFISPDLIIAVLGDYFLGKGEHHRVLQDIRTSRSVAEYLQPLGAEMFTWKVGRAFATPELRRINGIFGGELAGHYYFRDFSYSDSGILASLIVCDVLARKKAEGLSVSDFIKQISNYHSSGELNFVIQDKKAAIEEVIRHFQKRQKPLSVMDFDGYRLDYKDYWINIRPSNTEPYLRFIAEAKSKDQLAEIVGEVKGILGRY
ncbi:MAG: phosphomannomutase/phosphoglucomutase [Bacteroidales bacterium]|nr:phosphomannomutase/phosphoglucomutase [Bacteroidales bacterium]